MNILKRIYNGSGLGPGLSIGGAGAAVFIGFGTFTGAGYGYNTDTNNIGVVGGTVIGPVAVAGIGCFAGIGITIKWGCFFGIFAPNK